MKFGLINVISSVLAVSVFWIYHSTDNRKTNEVTNRIHVFTYHAHETNGRFQLYSNGLIQWIVGMNDNELKNSSIRQSLTTIFSALCSLSTDDPYTSAFETCCVPPRIHSGKSDLIWCLQRLGHIGTVPVVREAQNHSRSLPVYPPRYNHSALYIDDLQQSDGTIACRVRLGRRADMYQLLLQWIRIAEEHRIVWWLSSGSLLGAVRHKDFIPYDHDADVAVLGIYESTIQKLSVKWKDALYEKPFLITRHCRSDFGISLNCRGIPVRFLIDPCVFCTPTARFISGPHTFLDVFMVHAKVVVDVRNANVTRVGLLDESVDADWTKPFSYSLNDLFPLSTCNFMGLIVPCPRNPDSILAHTYGRNYIKPHKLCRQRYRVWN
ncbi:hypothetical protein CRM22_003687 [Opisthorchis felineus]|uniref:LicD/FKTN/FKRP nucleotidyltransferase domain-containing protein n=1 Tax=Opisthorchis felineus TaxID=147828 RepID=A0A4S2M034_OPIFE|nr:hypothetical protein CRM22_003687 [Opisthorchis felineus]